MTWPGKVIFNWVMTQFQPSISHWILGYIVKFLKCKYIPILAFFSVAPSQHGYSKYLQVWCGLIFLFISPVMLLNSPRENVSEVWPRELKKIWLSQASNVLKTTSSPSCWISYSFLISNIITYMLYCVAFLKCCFKTHYFRVLTFLCFFPLISASKFWQDHYHTVVKTDVPQRREEKKGEEKNYKMINRHNICNLTLQKGYFCPCFKFCIMISQLRGIAQNNI